MVSGLTFKVSSSSSTSQFNPFNNTINASTSEISGTPIISTGSSANTMAGIKATVAFFAPLIRTVPFNLCPPSMAITSCDIIVSFDLIYFKCLNQNTLYLFHTKNHYK